MLRLSRGKCVLVLSYPDEVYATALAGLLVVKLRKVKIGFPNSSSSCADVDAPAPRVRMKVPSSRLLTTQQPDYCFFDEQPSKTGRPVKRNLKAINASARSATEMSIMAVIALRKGLSRKP